jgi:hypothetical protein
MTTVDTLFNTARVINARNFKNLPNTDKLYLFLGEADAPNSNSPTPNLNVDYEKYTRNNIFFLKKILFTDIALVIPKITWMPNVVYTEYSSSDTALFGKNFYVNVGSSVYKCLGNNNGVHSVIAPSGTSVNDIILADSYIWKFMYNLSDVMQSNFTIDEYIPVPMGDQKTTQQISVEVAAVQDSTSPVGGHGSNAAMELGANSAMVSKGITFNNVSSGIVNQRQFGLFLNPLFTTGLPLTDVFYNNINTVNLMSGDIIQVESHDVISSSVNDTVEILQIIIGF